MLAPGDDEESAFFALFEFKRNPVTQNSLLRRKKILVVPLYSGPVKVLVTPPCGASSNIALWRAKIKPPVELVVGDLEKMLAPGDDGESAFFALFEFKRNPVTQNSLLRRNLHSCRNPQNCLSGQIPRSLAAHNTAMPEWILYPPQYRRKLYQPYFRPSRISH